MQQVLDKLFQIVPTLPTKLRNAAKVVLDNPNLVATTSMRGMAKRSGVTPPTMIRLANALGFENYESFRQVFQDSVNNQNFKDRANWLQQASQSGGEATVVHDIANASIGNVRHFYNEFVYNELDLKRLCHAADMIVGAPNVYVLAAGGLYWIASYLHYVCKMAVPHIHLHRNSGDGLVEGLVSVRENDVILTMAYLPYSRHSIDASRFALSRGARLIYMTDSKAAPLASEAEVLLLQKTESPQFFPSMISVMSAIETLIALVVARSGEDAIRSIAEYSEIRETSELFIS